MTRQLKVLVGCEFSGRVRNAFRALGHAAWSCDLLDTEDGSKYHIKGDVGVVLNDGWDIGIFHPPCTHPAVSGSRWFKYKLSEQAEALMFVQELLDAPIPHMALENPVSVISTRIRKPDQVINPWQFGHGETKRTCLWLKNLPKLVPTEVVQGRVPACHMTPDRKNRWKDRSRTYPGIAIAMAEQWSKYVMSRSSISD